MTIKYGDDLEDISADEAELEALLLDGARARERERATGADGEPLDATWDGEPLAADPDPGYTREGWRETLLGDGSPAQDKPKAVRVTAAVRKDVRGKTGLFLSGFGAIWARRDPYCGGTFLQTLPSYKDEDSGEVVDGLVDAMTDIFCDSPDVVAWFTTTGRFMKYLKVVSLLEPVAGAVWAHHVAHSADEAAAEPDWSAYRAGG